MPRGDIVEGRRGRERRDRGKVRWIEQESRIEIYSESSPPRRFRAKTGTEVNMSRSIRARVTGKGSSRVLFFSFSLPYFLRFLSPPPLFFLPRSTYWTRVTLESFTLKRVCSLNGFPRVYFRNRIWRNCIPRSKWRRKKKKLRENFKLTVVKY